MNSLPQHPWEVGSSIMPLPTPCLFQGRQNPGEPTCGLLAAHLPTPQVVAGSAKEKVTGTAEPGMVSVDRDSPKEGKPGGRGF